MKRKLENFLYYYKWYIAAAAVLLLLIVDFAVQKSEFERYDMEFSVVTVNGWTDAQSEELAAGLSEIYGCKVGVNLYACNGEPMEAEDTARFAADTVHLAADINDRISIAYFTDDADYLLDGGELILAAGNTGKLSELPESFVMICDERNMDIVEKLF